MANVESGRLTPDAEKSSMTKVETAGDLVNAKLDPHGLPLRPQPSGTLPQVVKADSLLTPFR